MNISSIKFFVTGLCAILLFPGCVKRVALPENTGEDTVVISRKEFLSIARQHVADSIALPDSIVYKPDVIFPGDQLGLSIYEKLPISMDKRVELRRVDGRGMIFLLPIGTIKVGGLTTSDAEQMIAEKLKEYVVSPHIELAITEREIGKEQVYIFGKVSTQGTFALRENYRILDLFADAGGINTSIYVRPIRLIRVQGDKVIMTAINLKDIFIRGKIDQNLLLHNQDIVYVPPEYLSSTKEILGLVSEMLPWYFFVYTLMLP